VKNGEKNGENGEKMEKNNIILYNINYIKLYYSYGKSRMSKMWKKIYKKN